MLKMIRSLFTEYGILWAFNRSLYSLKLRILSIFPFMEGIFEKDPRISRIDIFDFNIDEIGRFLRKLPNTDKEEIVDIADRAIDGVIEGFSSTRLDYGSPINWHLNPLTGRESPRDKSWYRIADFDPDLGDIKAVWEASRFTHLFFFSRAYLINGDEKYYRAFSNQVEDWLDKNKYSLGANYKCGQEASLRMVNILMNYSIFRAAGLTNERDRENVKEIVRYSYKKVLSNFFYAHKCIKNNHTFSEILGLMVGAWASEDDYRLRKAYDLLDAEIRSQFFEDGAFKQYSFNYQRFTLQILECVYKISERTGLSIGENQIVKNSALLMYHFQSDGGFLPNYGSNDGALIFPLSSCDYRDFRPVISTIYGLIEGKRLYDFGKYDEELVWFLGTENLPKINIDRVSTNYDNSGFFSLRHSRGILATYLQKFTHRPAHMDQLHIDLWHRGINIFCDSGTYSYASELGSQLSMTGGHNTVKLENREQMTKKGAFFVMDWTRAEDISCSDGTFQGTMVSKNGYKHSRTIKKQDYGYKIIDKIEGSGGYLEILFHSPLDVKIKEDGFDLYLDKELFSTVITSGDISVKKAYRSLYYLKKEEISCVSVRHRMDKGYFSGEFDIYLS